MRYDWNSSGSPRAARVNRIGMWWLTILALFACPVFLWGAVTEDWTLAFPAVLVGTGAVVQRLALRKAYGVRKPEAVPAGRPQTHAEAVAEAVEAQRQRQWDAIAERAFQAKPPPREAVPMRDAETGEPVQAGGLAITGEKSLVPCETSPGTALLPPMAGMALGFARLAAAMGGCAHANAEPVDLLVTAERVAWICPECPAELPANWRS